MVTYILRRLLLMIPTLIGITFVVFMLIALSPGGIGAGLLVSGGAMQSQSQIAIQKAKLEDRYGLNEPAIVQYGRWLGRVSPIKFGRRDLVSPSGELITRPRPVPTPAVWRWFADELPRATPLAPEWAAERFGDKPDDEKARAFRRIEGDYVEARARVVAAQAMLADALKTYAEELGDGSLLNSKREARIGAIERTTPDRTLKSFAEVERHGRAAIDAYGAAAQARLRYIAAMGHAPFPQAGVGIIPGVVSIAWPDLGIAFSRGRPVINLIAEALPVTLMLNLIAFPIIYLVAIPSGMAAATRKGTFVDVGLGGLYLALFSIPAVLAGVLLQGFMANPDYLNAFPTAGLSSKGHDAFRMLPGTDFTGAWHRGWLMDRVWHIVLPVACLVYASFAVISKQTRAAMLENFNADYVRTAKAKGVAPRDVILRHVFRNSLLPLITMAVTIFPAMLAGSVVIEKIFTVPGMGLLLIEAINLRDRELILANAAMIAVVNLCALLLADILYALADPRITYR
ncbi:MAG: ABC transporter permease [Phycisphaeraceae bacterium]|nr:ABC transporter permease [Phycisphaeraceae bacterium]MBX3406085.1 ABC transporter permease [Phycisphaeraceae bacterium]